MKSFRELASFITHALGEDVVVSANETAIQPFLEVRADRLPTVCRFLFENPALYFDYLACVTGIDNGPEKGTMEVVYHLNSIPFGHSLVIKVELERERENGELPVVPTVSTIWRTADWHEREIFDLLGIHFEGHPDLRRILLPADWEGYPLRKDYREQEYYHGIRVQYEDRTDPGQSED
jgi:NADH-quinone oxidoreductase subunit C